MPGEPPTEDASPAPDSITYHRDVAPLLARHCTTCHREGGIGPFALTSFTEAHETAGAIADATGARIMPPWPADGGGDCNTFLDRRHLDDAEIALLAAWAADGAPEGDPRDAVAVTAPPEPAFTPAIGLASVAPYVVAPGPDEYRCFVVDPQLTAEQFMTAIRPELDKSEVVHHIQLFSADTAEARTTIASRDVADPGPGYACDTEGTGPGLRYVGVWGAGDRVRRWPDGTGVPVPADAHLVLQLHYHNHGSIPLADQTRIDLELAPSVASPASIWSVHGLPLDLPPGRPEISVTRHRRVAVTAPSHARAFRLHMHTLGIRAKLELVRNGVATCLLDIPRWDFQWQLFYTLAQPIAMLPTDSLLITCAYDTTSRTETTTWGIATDDEMCLGYVYSTPD